ncbi:MAG: N-acetylmuramoyl-L-alanine amidase [Endomicrobiaceae bacterium]|nr:N-acetylmuramoyl-L-alanine amidase [Endomicrobiaceae bacterium]
MKKLLLCLSLLMFLCSAGVFSDKKNDSEIKIDIQKANVIFDGINHNGINIYEIQKENFLSLNEIAVLFNARIEWQPVSGKVSMKLKNRSIDIFYNTKKITYGKKKKKLYTPSLNIHNEIYVPAEFLTYKEFTNISETIVTFDKKNRLFVINSQTNISAVRYYTKENSTEISIELNEKMTHTVKKAKNAIIVAFQRGKIANDTIYIDNGIIKNISYGTAGREAVFKINLQQKPKLVSTKKFKKPLKFVITIEHSAPVDMSKPCLVSLPETVVPDENIENTVLSEESNIAKISTEEESPEIPVINQAVITAESEVYEKPVSDGDDIEDLAKIKTPSVSDDQIIDDSYAIVDEKGTFKDIIPSEKEKSQTAKLIVLDAGHGGEDPGAIGPNGTKEKDINLAITLALKKLFDKDKNYKVILTRTNDIFIPLAERTNIANENKADLFISIHNNANFKKEISGFEIYFLSENASDSEAAATAILENSVVSLENKPKGEKEILQNMLWSMVVNEYINDSSELSSFISCETTGRLKIPFRGIKQANFFVLRGTQMPAVLVEGAYLSNYGDEAKLNTKRFQLSIADSIYEGVKKYYARKSKNGNGKK